MGLATNFSLRGLGLREGVRAEGSGAEAVPVLGGGFQL